MSREAISKMLSQLTENTQKAKDGFVNDLMEKIAADGGTDLKEVKASLSKTSAELEEANAKIDSILEQLDGLSAGGGAADAGTDDLSGELREIKNSLEELADQIETGFSAGNAAVVQSDNSDIVSAIEQLKAELSAAREDDGGKLSGEIISVLDEMKTELSQASSADIDKLSEELSGALEEMKRGLPAADSSDNGASAAEFISALEEMKSELSAAVRAEGERLSSELRSGSSSESDTVEYGFMEIKEQLAPISEISKIIEAVEALKAEISALSENMSSEENGDSQDNTALIEEIRELLKSGNDETTEALSACTAAAANVQNDVASAAGMITSEIREYINESGSGITEEINAAKTAVLDEIRMAAEEGAKSGGGLTEEDLPIITEATAMALADNIGSISDSVSVKNKELIDGISEKLSALTDEQKTINSQISMRYDDMAADFAKLSETVELSTQGVSEQIVSEISAKIEEITENNKSMVDEFALGTSALADDVGEKLQAFSADNKAFLEQLSEKTGGMEQEFSKAAISLNALKTGMSNSDSFIKQSANDISTIKAATEGLVKSVETQNHSNLLSQMDSSTFGITKEIGLITKDIDSIKENIDTSGDKIRELSDSIESALATFTKLDATLEKQQETDADVAEKCSKISTNMLAVKKISDQLENNSNWQIESLDSNFRRLTSMLYAAIVCGIVNFIGIAVLVVMYVFFGDM